MNNNNLFLDIESSCFEKNVFWRKTVSEGIRASLSQSSLCHRLCKTVRDILEAFGAVSMWPKYLEICSSSINRFSSLHASRFNENNMLLFTIYDWFRCIECHISSQKLSLAAEKWRSNVKDDTDKVTQFNCVRTKENANLILYWCSVYCDSCVIQGKKLSRREHFLMGYGLAFIISASL